MVRALVVSVCLSVVALAGCGSSRNPAEADCDFYVENELCPTLQQCGATYS
jgi:hypothetical protein